MREKIIRRIREIMREHGTGVRARELALLELSDQIGSNSALAYWRSVKQRPWMIYYESDDGSSPETVKR